MDENSTSVHASARAAEPQGAYKLPALRALSEITSSLASDADVEDLLARFLSTMIRLAGAMAGAVRVATHDGAHLRLAGSIGLPPEVVERERYVPYACGVCGKAISEESVESCAPDEVCRETTALGFFGETCKRVVAVPLRHRGRVMGAYNLFLGSDKPIPDEVALLFSSISEHLGMALENARLTRENVRATLVDERQMLANEVHDSLAQTLAYAKMRLSVLGEALAKGDRPLARRYLGEVELAMESAYGRLRELLTHFRERMDPRGLVPALEDLVASFGAQFDVHAEFRNRAPEPDLTPERELHVYHIVQEALANASKHSRARNLWVTIDRTADGYTVSVEDDGAGLAAGGDSRFGMRFGLSILRERAARLGDPRAPRRGPEQQGDRRRAQHQPGHREAARAARAREAQPLLPRRGGGVRRRAQARRGAGAAKPKRSSADGSVKATNAARAPGQPARNRPSVKPSLLLAGPGRN
jgi:two-component system nitrate/nitrite sensor histidine kinase NarX